jgi:hypothetical protein
VVIPNSHRSTPRILEPPSRRRSPKDAAAVAADEAFFHSLGPEGGADLVDAGANARISGSESEAAAAWTAALLPLVKGKITLDKTKIAQTSDALGEVEHANKRGSFAREVLMVSKVLLSRAPIEDWLLTGIICALGERAGGHGTEAR